MLATAEADVREDTGTQFETEQSTAVAVIECPVALPVVNDLRAKYGALTIVGIDDKAGFSAVDEARKHCKRVRLQVENWRKDQNEEALKHQRRVNAAAKLIREPLELLEDTLARKQKAVTDEVERLKREAEENAKAERAAKLNARMDALAAVKTYQIPSEVEKFTDEGFAEFLAIATKSNDDRVAQEAEAKRLFEQDQERQRREDERLAAERKRLEDERAEFDRLCSEQAERDAEAQRQKEAEEHRGLKEANAKLQSRIAAVEALNGDPNEYDLANMPDGDFQALLPQLKEAETDRLRRKNEADRLQEETDRKAAEERAELERQRLEALRPDREKLLAFADSLEAFRVPDVAPELKLVRALCVGAVADAATAIRDIVAKRVK